MPETSRPSKHEEQLSLLLRMLPGSLQSSEHLATYQKLLSEAFRASERRSSSDQARESLPQLERDHRHRLRILGDTLAWVLLGDHTVRALGRTVGPRPGLESQGQAFEAVLRIADQRAAQGHWPIVSDLTNLLQTGDLVVKDGDDLEIVECKIRNSTSKTKEHGRVLRQRQRGEATAQYLGSGTAPIAEGLRQLFGVRSEVEGKLIAIETSTPEPAWKAVADVVSRAKADTSGAALLDFSEGDHILALYNRGPDTMRVVESMFNNVNLGKYPTIAMHTHRMRHPLPLAPPVTYFPLSSEDWLALLMERLLLCRLVDLSLFERSYGVDDTEVRLKVQNPAAPWLQAYVRGEHLALGPKFLEQVLYGYQPIESVAESAARFVSLAQVAYPPGESATPGRKLVGFNEPLAKYSTVYTDES